MRVNRGNVVLVDYPFTTGGAKVRPALVVQNDRDNARMTRSRGQAFLLVCLSPRPWRLFQEPGEVLVFPGVEKCREPFLDKVRASWTPQSVLGGSPVASLPPQPHGPSPARLEDFDGSR